MMWALFVVGHDCGHGSFSKYPWLNHLIGHLSHTPLLVPYHSWRFSHGRHHVNHGHVDNDESYHPIPRESYMNLSKNFGSQMAKLFRYTLFIFGFPLYLKYGLPGHWYSHYDPDAKNFTDDQRDYVIVTVRWMRAWIALLAVATYFFGVWTMLAVYFVPYLVQVAWLGTVTMLHHTHPEVAWYRDPEWSYLRGALSTVDRHYGPLGLLEPVHHNIGTHVVHHVFRTIPHYRLKEAHTAMRPLLGDYYKISHESVLRSIVRVWRTCRFVRDDGSVLFYYGDDDKTSIVPVDAGKTAEADKVTPD
jgi:omega-3 fatty acid desaturase (delta-15 desaturase)